MGVYRECSTNGNPVIGLNNVNGSPVYNSSINTYQRVEVETIQSPPQPQPQQKLYLTQSILSLNEIVASKPRSLGQKL